MYPLNTTLIFTSLTHASAAADLFGEDALDSLIITDDYSDQKDKQKYATGKDSIHFLHGADVLSFEFGKPEFGAGDDVQSVSIWIRGFELSIGTYDGCYMTAKWRIILDTPGKAAWFTPELGDLICSSYGEYFVVSEIKNNLVYNPFSEIAVMHGAKQTPYVPVFRIVQRDGQPFPAPQEIQKPKETV